MKSKLGLLVLVSTIPFSAMGATMSTINTTLKDDAIQIDNASVAAGKVTFVITNSSPKLVHELVVLKPDMAEDQLPVKKNGKVDEAKLKNKGEVEDIAPGTTKKLTLKLAHGKYVLVCNMPGHYQMGMRAAFTVD